MTKCDFCNKEPSYECPLFHKQRISYCDKALLSAINIMAKARGQRQLVCPLDDSYFIDNGVSKINFEETEEEND